MLLAKFANEVLSGGPAAVLPRNLNPEWLAVLQKMADDFLDANFEADDCLKIGDIVHPVLTACVSELLNRRQAEGGSPAPGALTRKITIYAIQLTIETLRRNSGLEVPPASLDNIFEPAGLFALREKFPAMAQFLDRVCLSEER